MPKYRKRAKNNQRKTKKDLKTGNPVSVKQEFGPNEVSDNINGLRLNNSLFDHFSNRNTNSEMGVKNAPSNNDQSSQGKNMLIEAGKDEQAVRLFENKNTTDLASIIQYNPLSNLNLWIKNNMYTYNRIANLNSNCVSTDPRLNFYGNKYLNPQEGNKDLHDKINSIIRVDKSKVKSVKEIMASDKVETKEPSEKVEKFNKGTQYRLFTRLQELLIKHLMGDQITSDDLLLSSHELTILRYVMRRKYKDDEFICSDFQSLINKLNAALNKHDDKKVEICYKTIIRKCVRHIRNIHGDNPFPPTYKNKGEEYLFNKYFKNVAKKYSLKMEDFSISNLNLPADKSNVPGNVNKAYIKRICLSDNFMKEFIDCLDNHFLSLYENTIEVNVSSLIDDWRSIFHQFYNSSTAIEAIVSYITSNTVIKMPYNVNQIKRGIDQIRLLIESR